MTKSSLIMSVLVVAMILESLFTINVYLLIILMCIAFWFVSSILDEQVEMQSQKESMQLQNQINYTSKDAYLKNKQLKTIATSIPYPMMLINQTGQIVLRNKQLESFSNLPLDEEVTYLHNDFPRTVQEFIKDAYILEKELNEIIDVNMVEYQAISVPITTKSKFSGCFIMLQDISKALEGEKMQKRFIADASHELKTPIAVIKGMVEILNRDDFDDDITRIEFLHQIEEETNRLDVMVKDMLELSRMSVSHPILNRSKCDIIELLDNCIRPLKKSAEAKNLKISTEYIAKDKVFCDSIKMGQVFTNLLTNAIKYSDHGSIEVKTSCDDKYYTIQIKDQGHGLNSEQQEKIFDRFYRVNDDRSRKSGGSGLGLAIVKSIVDAHSGKIEINSIEGAGTTFLIKLKN